MIELRRDFHKHAEIAFNEHRTQRVLKETLLSFGISEENIKACAGTGLVVDIKGTGEA
jgi:metal-dependent amidase/aminoacylase/carboxypeptidase family protein